LVLWIRIRGLDLEAHQQGELLLRFVVPEFSRSNFSPFLDESDVLVILTCLQT
jgi:hypothetical protein